VSARELADTARLLGLPESEVRLQPVRMILLMQPSMRRKSRGTSRRSPPG